MFPHESKQVSYQERVWKVAHGKVLKWESREREREHYDGGSRGSLRALEGGQDLNRWTKQAHALCYQRPLRNGCGLRESGMPILAWLSASPT